MLVVRMGKPRLILSGKVGNTGICIAVCLAENMPKIF